MHSNPNPDAAPYVSSRSHHRRGPSELASRIADGLALGPDDDLLRAYLDVENLASCLDGDLPCGGGAAGDDPMAGGAVAKPKHRYSNSVDGSSATSDSVFEPKKAMSADQLAELAVVDPKRAKRIVANRQSAARSKERKARYVAELQRRVQILQVEATTLSAQLSLLQRDTSVLTTENEELRLQLRAIERQVRLCDVMNEALTQELERLMFITGESTIPGETCTIGSQSKPNTQPFFSLPQKQGGVQFESESKPQDHHTHSNSNHAHASMDIMRDEHLGRLIVTDTSKGSFLVNSDCSSMSLSESGCNF